MPARRLRDALQSALLLAIPVGVALLAAGCGDKKAPDAAAPAATATASPWPEVTWPLAEDAAIEKRIDELMAKMTVEEKVGQIVQGDIASLTPDDVRKYRLGSVLAGGNSDPGGKYDATPAQWLALADAFYEASMDTSKGGQAIPIVFGIDAIHGQSNIVGATLFPHNIGLGATRNPDLMQQIGHVTAVETRTTGMEWAFAPTVAVPQDDRWGRTYEGYSESPDVVASFAGRMVEGLQGKPGAPDFLDGSHVMVSVKHFLGDGGTTGGKDQGDTKIDEAELARIHGAGYPPSIAAGAQTVMASFNSVNGEKMHGNRHLLTDVLKGRMNFGGFVVGDWNGHGQVKGCTNENCPATIAAGLDMAMASDSWRGFYESALAAVKAGTLPMERLDDAVRRILRVKFRLGLFEAGKPSQRPLGGKFELLGSPEHRAVARQAVRESLVLLQN
jgi:beta-glucosidase